MRKRTSSFCVIHRTVRATGSDQTAIPVDTNTPVDSKGGSRVATYRTAIIGCGGVSRRHFHGYHHPQTQLVAIAEIDEQKLEEAGKTNGVDRLYTDYRELLERERPDLVSVCTTAPPHRDITVGCAEAGVHVLCEKPMATNLAEADDMIEACDRAGVRLAINHQQRCSPQFKKTRELLEQGQIGELRAIQDRGKNRQGGYEMMEIGTHMFDAMQFFAGSVRSVYGHLTTDGHDTRPEEIMTSLEVDPRYRDIGLVAGDNIVAHFAFESGVVGLAEFYRSPGKVLHGISTRLLQGTEGIIANKPGGEMGTTVLFYPAPVYDPTSPEAWQRVPMTDEEMRLHGQAWPSGQVIRSIDEMVRCLEEDREHISDGRAGRAALEMIQGIYSSHFSGQRVTLPLADRRHALLTAQEGRA